MSASEREREDNIMIAECAAELERLQMIWRNASNGGATPPSDVHYLLALLGFMRHDPFEHVTTVEALRTAAITMVVGIAQAGLGRFHEAEQVLRIVAGMAREISARLDRQVATLDAKP